MTDPRLSQIEQLEKDVAHFKAAYGRKINECGEALTNLADALSKVKELEADYDKAIFCTQTIEEALNASITERKQLESRLAAAEELATVADNVEQLLADVAVRMLSPNITMAGRAISTRDVQLRLRAALAKFRSVK